MGTLLDSTKLVYPLLLGSIDGSRLPSHAYMDFSPHQLRCSIPLALPPLGYTQNAYPVTRALHPTTYIPNITEPPQAILYQPLYDQKYSSTGGHPLHSQSKLFCCLAMDVKY